MSVSPRKIVLLLAIVLMMPIAAQEETTTETTTSTTATATTDGTDRADEPAASSSQTRQELARILERVPPQIGRALKLDPSLWTNQAFLSRYPDLAKFAAAHPEVAYHSNYYLEHIYMPGDYVPRPPAIEMWDQMFEMIGIFCMVILFVSAFLYLVRTILDHRRWSRLTKVNTEVHTKLLDRFGSNEELMAYMNTDPGKRFLDASPIAVEQSPRAIAAPIGRVLWSIQVGVVLAAAGLGFALISWNVTEKEVSQPLGALGTLGLAIGIGFVASAVISFVLSRKLGLLQLPSNFGDTKAEGTN